MSVRDEALELPGNGEILLESIVSAISPGTEMLFYRGDILWSIGNMEGGGARVVLGGPLDFEDGGGRDAAGADSRG